MVISGANAGGKTVVLKNRRPAFADGPFQLYRCPQSLREYPFYRSVLADIGDHQSLAANLSTFSSHVANIASMIVIMRDAGTGLTRRGRHRHGPGRRLGPGAVAVVDHFKQRGAQVLATTHYSGFENVCRE
jgi:DNA mismatch repair protein MutS2